ncbi:MAG: restriction endonuclease subunit S [Chthoniobacterales bacterium]
MNAPQEWPFFRLAEIAETCSGTTPSRSRRDYFGGTIPWVKTGELTDGLITKTEEYVTDNALRESALRLLPKKTLLVAMYGQGQTRGRTGLLGCEATTNQACFAILPNERIDTEFLQFWFRSSYQRLRFLTANRGANQPNLNGNVLSEELIPLPSLSIQRTVAEKLRERFSHVATARSAVEAQIKAVLAVPAALTREDTLDCDTSQQPLGDVLDEITAGVGDAWRNQSVLGATRAGLAPAKEGVGKQPHRYKPVTPGTVFYNPMRILLGSIALVDDGDTSGITSPDYVVIRGRKGVLHPVWFYYWFRSPAGAEFIKTLTRGAVRERLLFNRLAPGLIPVPTWDRQLVTVERVRAAERARSSFAARLKVLEKLPATLLREVFGGEAVAVESEAVVS